MKQHTYVGVTCHKKRGSGECGFQWFLRHGLKKTKCINCQTEYKVSWSFGKPKLEEIADE